MIILHSHLFLRFLPPQPPLTLNRLVTTAILGISNVLMIRKINT